MRTYNHFTSYVITRSEATELLIDVAEGWARIRKPVSCEEVAKQIIRIYSGKIVCVYDQFDNAHLFTPRKGGSVEFSISYDEPGDA